MRKKITILIGNNLQRILLVLLFFIATSSFSQKVWDGSSSNNWNTAANWTPSGVPAAADDVVIDINATISVNTNATINSLTISGGATVSLTSSGAARTITIDNTGSSVAAGSVLSLIGSTGTRTMSIIFTGTNRTMAIAGTLDVTSSGAGSLYTATNSLTTVTGTLINSGGTITSTAANLTISSGGIYEHATNGGTISTATWSTGATCLVTGVTGTRPGGLGQNFHHFTWNCAGQTSSVTNLASNGFTTVNGNLTVSSTGSFALNLNSSGTNRTIAVGGNYIQTDGYVDFTSGNGTTTINLSGNLDLTSTGIIDSTTANAPTSNGTFVFTGSGNKTLNLTSAANIGYINFAVNSGNVLDLLSGVWLAKSANAPWRGTFTVNSGGTVNLGNQVVDGNFTGTSGGFNINSGAKAITANATGLQGSVNSTNVTPTFNSGGSYEFRGTNTGVFTLTTANTITGILTFNRSAGVTSDQDFIATTLALTSGIVTTGSNSITVASGGTITGASATNYISGILKRVYPSATTLVFPVGKGGNYRPVTFQYTALTGTSTVTVEQMETALTGTLPGSTNLNNARTWNISQTGGSAFTYKVTLDPTGDAVSGTVVMLKKESGTITSNAVTTPNYTNTSAFNTLTGTNNFTLGSTCTVSANAGSNESLCYGTTFTTLSANTPVYGTGTWTVSGPSSSSAQFSNVNDPSSDFTPAGGAGVYTLTWTISNGSCSSASNVTLAFGGVVTWTGSWSPSAPTSVDAAVISSNYNVSADIDACTLTVDSGAVVTIPSTYNVSLNGALTVSSGSFTLENNANLIQAQDVANSGNITVKRDSNALKRLDYVGWSSPVASQNLLAFSPLTVTNRFYTYVTNASPTPNVYVAVASPSTTSFNVGQGYLIRLPNNHTTWASIWHGQYTGVPNNGTQTVSLINAGSGQRFNMIGNPYPSTISMTQFVADNSSNITGTLYFWRKTNSTVSSPGYCTWAGGTFTTNGEAEVYDPASILQVGQGFFVEASATGTSVEFNNGQRVADNANQTFRNNSAVATPNTIEYNRVWLNMTSTANEFAQMAVGYITDATQGVDLYDGKYFNDGPISLTSIINSTNYAIQGRSLPFDVSDIVSLNYSVTNAGNYTIAIDHKDGLFAGETQDIFLKDNVLNTYTNLNNGSYSFTSAAGSFNDRFEIVYQDGALSVQNPALDSNAVIVYKNNGAVVVNTGSIEMATVKIFDIRGRFLVEKTNINASEIRLNVEAANQVLLVQVTSTEGQIVTKKIIN